MPEPQQQPNQAQPGGANPYPTQAERKVLEDKAKKLIKDMGGPAKGGVGSEPSLPKRTPKVAGLLVVLLLVVMGGVGVGMRLLTTDDVGDVRRQASEPYIPAISPTPKTSNREYCGTVRTAGTCCVTVSQDEFDYCDKFVEEKDKDLYKPRIQIYYYKCPGSGDFPSGCSDNGVLIKDYAQVGDTVCIEDTAYCGTHQIDYGCFSTLSSYTIGWASGKTWDDAVCEDVSPTSPPTQPSNTPAPIRTPTPTLPPGVTPSVTPTPVLACTAIQFSSMNVNYGDTVTLTCTGNPAGDVGYAYFQYSVNSGAYQNITNATNTTAQFKIDRTGSYNVRCRVCRSADVATCTGWQAAGVN
jgi:hypothetical protein